MNRTTLITTCATALVVGLLLNALLAAPNEPQAAQPAADPAKRNLGWFDDDASQLIFFAVLEGLYNDAVPRDIVDVIVPLAHTIPSETNTQPLGHRDFYEHFVYMCPLCHPSYEAWRLYAERKDAFGKKGGPVNRYGPDGALPAEIVKLLRSDKKTDRLQGLKLVTDRWVKQRLDLMRLTQQERRDWDVRIQALRDKGTKQLQLFQAAADNDEWKQRYADWKFCPSCDGSLGACKTDAGAHR